MAISDMTPDAKTYAVRPENAIPLDFHKIRDGLNLSLLGLGREKKRSAYSP